MFALKINPIKKIFQNSNKYIKIKFQSTKTTTKGNKTSLYNFHKEKGGKLINFGGYMLPVSYAGLSISDSHIHTRQYASIFDVSHMLQTYIHGKDAISCFEKLCTADIHGAKNGAAILTVFLSPSGGILDDLIVTKVNEKTLYIVSNATMKEQDKQLMENAISEYKKRGKDVYIHFMDTRDQSLIALQGPISAEILKKYILPGSLDLDKFYFMNSISTDVCGFPNCRVTRCGYTGEDGFEISVSSEYVEKLTNLLLSNKKCLLAGLGARDSLRLEAGLCLYGSDIDKETTPVEAGLVWLIAQRRRLELNFPGAKVIYEQMKHKGNIRKKRVGFVSTEMLNSPPARNGVKVYYKGNVVGYITSGCPSPTLRKNIAMGYIKNDLSEPGQVVQFKIRNNFFEAEITRLPFVKHNFYVRS